MNKKCYLMSSESLIVLTDSLSLLSFFFKIFFKIAFQHNSFLCSTGSYIGNTAGAKVFPSKLTPHQDSKIYGHSVCLTFFVLDRK